MIEGNNGAREKSRRELEVAALGLRERSGTGLSWKRERERDQKREGERDQRSEKGGREKIKSKKCQFFANMGEREKTKEKIK